MGFIKKSMQKRSSPGQSRQQDEQQRLSSDLPFNVNQFKEIFSYPVNNALKVREVSLPFFNNVGIILFLEGAADTSIIDKHIVEPLMEEPAIPLPNEDIASILLKNILTVYSGKIISTFQDATHELLNGNTVILFEGEELALSIETPGFKNRSISGPSSENVLKGPKEAFVETAAVNRSLIRKEIKDQNLMCEFINIGERAAKQVSVMYVKHIANPEMVEHVKERIAQIKSDIVLGLSMLEQHIEERPYSLIPSALTTERPDRACAFLLEGHVILLMENSPYALIVPVTFWSFFHTAEDQYLRWPYGNFIRIVRLLAFFVALLTPSLYIAVSTFHEEMLPTDLVLAIGATRERVPFPAFVEVLIMEIAFELLREAGIRIPQMMGPTIGIVGALILGQAAVDANIISPILVIIVALTGLSSFAIPDVSFNFAVRILRFFILLSAAFMGFLGIA